MKKQFILLILLVTTGMSLNAQSGLVGAVGVSIAYTDNPVTSEKGKMISGYHGSLTGRFGGSNWYVRPGIEVHKMKLLPEKMLDPFSNAPAMYLLKFPAQLGLRIIKSENFKLRVAGGLQFSYTVSIQKNNLGLNHNTITDTQFGALIGAGLDLGPITFDINFEKGMTELYTNTGYTADYFFISAGVFF